MTNDEAKFILQSYRHNGADADDPVFRDALEQARRDPALAKWLAEETGFDAAISRKLKSIPVPPELKSNILAGGKIVKPIAWWRGPWLAAAAAFALLLGIGGLVLQSNRAPQFAAFRATMIQHSLKDAEHVTFASRDMSRIQQWFAEHGLQANLDLPATLAAQSVHGCRIVDWNGKKVGVICVMLNDKNHTDLFVIDRTKFQNFHPTETPQFDQINDVATAAWSRGDKIYLLAGKVPRETLLNFL